MPSIDRNQLNNVLSNLEKLGLQMKEIIGPFNTKDLSKKRSIELCQVGKFLTLFDTPVHIIEHRESPDFLISFNGETIGLEHERIIDANQAKWIKSVDDLFDQSALLFQSQWPQFKVLAHFYLSTKNLQIKKSDAELMKCEIVNYLYELMAYNSEVSKPFYIDHVRTMRHSGVNFYCSHWAFQVNYLNSDLLEQAIEKKERLIHKYLKDTNLQKQWLLLVIGSLSPDSFELDIENGKELIRFNKKSKFEKIFLMEDFHGKAWQVY